MNAISHSKVSTSEARRSASRRGAFSLIEVIVAVTLFAGAVAVILALLPGLALRGAENSDRLVAQRLPESVRIELGRLSAGGFDALAGRVPVASFPPVNGLALVASRDGTRVHSRDYLPPAGDRLADAEQYFLIECWRFPGAPLAFDAAQSALALNVRVSWPYHQPGSDASVPIEGRHEFTFVIGINR